MRNIFRRKSGFDKLIDIVLDSWKDLTEAIARGKVVINNSSQNEEQVRAELLYLLKKRGLQVIPDYKDSLSTGTHKTPSGNVKIDILATLPDDERDYAAAIELKHFPKIPGATTTDNRKAILLDVENLETYINDNIVDIGFFFLYTTDNNYMDDSRSKVHISSCRYKPEWQAFNNEQECFLTIIVNK